SSSDRHRALRSANQSAPRKPAGEPRSGPRRAGAHAACSRAPGTGRCNLRASPGGWHSSARALHFTACTPGERHGHSARVSRPPIGVPASDEYMGEITQLLSAANAGDRTAAERLFGLLYQELRGLAHSSLRRGGRPGDLETTVLVHESFLK